MIQRAEALERAAKAGDDNAVAEAYGKLAQACVQCHSTYMRSVGPEKKAAR
jgi:cytochrome c556